MNKIVLIIDDPLAVESQRDLLDSWRAKNQQSVDRIKEILVRIDRAFGEGEVAACELRSVIENIQIDTLALAPAPTNKPYYIRQQFRKNVRWR